MTTRAGASLALAIALLIGSGHVSGAATRTVTNLDDSGPGSLRQTIAAAASGDTINFGVTGTITLTTGELLVNKSLTINGPGELNLTIRRSSTLPVHPLSYFRVFNFTQGTSTLSSVTISNGDATHGAGIANSGNLTVQFCTIADNHAIAATDDHNSGTGGGIWNGGTMTTSYCTIIDNSARNRFNSTGSSGSGGGIVNTGTITISNSAITDNTAQAGGGGLANYGVSGARATLNGCTVSRNTAVVGAGIDNDGSSTFQTAPFAELSVHGCTFEANTAQFAGAINCDATTGTPDGANGRNLTVVENSTFANNSTMQQGTIRAQGAAGTVNLALKSCTFSGNTATGTGSEISGIYFQGSGATVVIGNTIFKRGSAGANLGRVGGSFTSRGYNLSDDGGAALLLGPADQINTDPKLDPAGLQSNGGFTQTIALVFGSPAIDKGNRFDLTTDQRGAARPVDNPSVVAAPGGDHSDIGAYEATADPPQSGFPSLVVTTTADHNDGTCGGADCTLREAVAFANSRPGAQNIGFETNVRGTIVLQALGELVVTDPVHIAGPGARLLAVSGNQARRVFTISNTTTISGLTIRDGWNVFGGTNGDTKQGGGIYNTAALTLNDCAFTGNFVQGGEQPLGTSRNGGNGQGGAIFNAGTLTLNRCLFYRASSGNIAAGGKAGTNLSQFGIGGTGGAGQGGAVFNAASGTLYATNCTFTANSVGGGNGGSRGSFGGNGGPGEGGAIYSLGSMTLLACTITGNHGSGGVGGDGNSAQNSGGFGVGKGGIVRAAGSSSVANTIVAANTAGGANPSYDVDGALGSAGYNLIGTAGHSTGFTAPGDQTGTEAARISPRLGELQNNGGPTDTMSPSGDSPAFDKGKGFALTIDQRGSPRTLDSPLIPNATGGDGTDIGAFEADAPQGGSALIVTTTGDSDDGVCGLFDCTLREAISTANALAGANNIRFLPSVTGTINLSNALPNLSTEITVQGPGANALTVRRNTGADYRIFTISNGTSNGPSVTISGLTIANGNANSETAPGGDGGGVANDRGTLTLVNCRITGNRARSFGGGVYNEAFSTLTIRGCTIDGNVAAGNGAGAIYNSAAQLTLTNSTVSGNNAPNGGAIINAGGFTGTANATLTGCTFSGNSAASNGTAGIRNGLSGTLVLRSNIFANAGTNLSNTGNPIVSHGYNLSSDAAGGATGSGPGGFLNAAGDIRNTDPLLLPLALNGGQTQTHALSLSSPAIDQGKAFGATHDQRGHLRSNDSPVVLNASGGDGADIGAFELHPVSGMDSDGDGMSNDYESFYGFQAGDPRDGALDNDGDGLTNAQEYETGTNPHDSHSSLRVTAVARSGDSFAVTFGLAVAGKTYRLERKNSLTDPAWSSIFDIADFRPDTTGSAQFIDPSGSVHAGRYYRVRVVP